MAATRTNRWPSSETSDPLPHTRARKIRRKWRMALQRGKEKSDPRQAIEIAFQSSLVMPGEGQLGLEQNVVSHKFQLKQRNRGGGKSEFHSGARRRPRFGPRFHSVRLIEGVMRMNILVRENRRLTRRGFGAEKMNLGLARLRHVGIHDADRQILVVQRCGT